ALAVVYCQLRGGRLPFEGNHFAIMNGHLNQAPDLTMLPEVERPVVAQALNKEGAQRYPSCTAFVRALAKVPAARVVRARGGKGPSTPWRNPATADPPPSATQATQPVQARSPQGTSWFALGLVVVGIALLILLPVGLVLYGLRPRGNADQHAGVEPVKPAG